MRSRQLFTRLFWLDAFERVVATVAEFLIVLGGANGAGWLDTSFYTTLLLAGAGGLAALLKSVAAAAKADTDTASLTVDTKPL